MSNIHDLPGSGYWAPSGYSGWSLNIPQKYYPNIVHKKWGREIIIANTESYCGKILEFKKDSKFSMHFHLVKHESWYVLKGSFTLNLIDTTNAIEITTSFIKGDCIMIPKGQPHQLIALEDSEIFEVSTTHFDSDSYRIKPGNSQA